MDRKRRISGRVLTCILLLISSCCRDVGRTEVQIVLNGTEMTAKAQMPDEEKISDACLLIFDNNGILEYSTYSFNPYNFKVSLLKGERYRCYVFVNFGYKIWEDTIEQLEKIEFHMAYPDEYRNGMPMYAESEIVITDNTVVGLELKRLMSRISIRMDRSRLSEDISMKVTSIKIGNCPKRVKVLENSRVEDSDDCFVTGFLHKGDECYPLNTEDRHRLSAPITLYMLENMQGAFSDVPIDADDEKVFEEYDKRRGTCSFIEIEMEYTSREWASTKNPLRYRFYLGSDRNCLDIERNCHYRITVCPEDNGLSGDGWRVDKSGLEYTGNTGLVKYPSEYIRGNIGDRIHLGCILTPSTAPFDIGIGYLEEDKAEGIYDYEIDPDGHGVTLTLTGPGQGLIYMEAGDPINEAALFIVEVNLPE